MGTVGRPDGGRVGDRGPPGLAAALGAQDAVLAHQPLHLAARDRLAGPKQRLPRAAVAVGLEVGLVHLADDGQQPGVLELAR
jgi:hypothetical protein